MEGNNGLPLIAACALCRAAGGRQYFPLGLVSVCNDGGAAKGRRVKGNTGVRVVLDPHSSVVLCVLCFRPAGRPDGRGRGAGPRGVSAARASAPPRLFLLKKRSVLENSATLMLRADKLNVA